MSAEQANLWDGLVQMGKELKRTHSAGLLSRGSDLRLRVH